MLKHPKPRSISSERENDRRSDSESTQMMTPSLMSAFGQKRTFGDHVPAARYPSVAGTGMTCVSMNCRKFSPYQCLRSSQ